MIEISIVGFIIGFMLIYTFIIHMFHHWINKTNDGDAEVLLCFFEGVIIIISIFILTNLLTEI